MISKALQALVPARWQHAAKAVLSVYAAALTAVVAAIPDAPRWLLVVVAVSSALGVYQVPNAVGGDDSA